MNAITRLFTPPAQPLMLTTISFDKSVIHSCMQDIGRKLMENLAHENAADWEEFIASADGKQLAFGIRKGLAHLLLKGTI